MKSFHLDIITPQRKVFSEEVDVVNVPTQNGHIGVLSHHEPLFCALTAGEIKVSMGEKEYYLAIGEGFMEVSSAGVSILVTRAFHAHELNENEIKKAQEAALHSLKNATAAIDRATAQAMLRRSILELKVFHRHHATTRLTN